MQIIFFLLFGLLVAEEPKMSFNVYRKDYKLLREFEFHEKDQLIGYAKKGGWVRTNYYLFSHNDQPLGLAQYKLCSNYGLGVLFSWAEVIYLYDSKGQQIGKMGGKVTFQAPAKYYFDDAYGHRLAKGYMDHTRRKIVLVDPHDINHRIARFERKTVPYQTDFWTVQVYDQEVLHPEMIQTFACYIVDRQDSFN